MDSSLVEEIASLEDLASNISLAHSYGLAIQTVSWEDTARTKNSCWGPNIADLTLHVADFDLPMIRKPNFADVTADVPMSFFSVTTGNEKPAGNLKRLFSYQARPDDPAALVIMASSQGTSAHVITGDDDKLLFNRGGAAAMFLAKRLSQDRRERGVPEAGAMTDDELDRNALLLFQIPLKQRPAPKRRYHSGYESAKCSFRGGAAAGSARKACKHARDASPRAGLEYATLRASDKTCGPFRGLGGFKLERDARFPIRVTFQMYTVTDDPVLKESQIKSLADKIEKVYARGEEAGSLVTNITERATEPRPLASSAGGEL
ncbi:hypothetical protein KFL_004390100 [Klebsormidium nitens]|uniref:Uncharacterized protein n=1 Tax=Klebsormidium nitens TaxID=105231 RepID=A0A1Y1IEY3_KLENI|nr:hypothetical protein KFL_004390100 [Klebsormidium nitens]|eukprot:GAQ88562.1 hypothetical protein KFL_004390100 [Klebsormidium nitens]